MPAAPRVKGKGKKIAFAILGMPPALNDKKSARKKKLDEILLYQDTQRSR